MHRHFTATAFIIDKQNRTLLLWHKRLNRWMPPGGHVDEDEMPESAAKRECKEETGLTVEIIGLDQHNVFASNPHEGNVLQMPINFLLENIPACPDRGEEAHQHMDFIYIAHPIGNVSPILNHNEASDMRWFSKEDIEKLDENTEIFSNVKTYILDLLS